MAILNTSYIKKKTAEHIIERFIIPNRKPELHIEGYLMRWHIIPRNKYGFNIYLHKIYGDDPGRDLHDHPWWSVSFKLLGNMVEILEDSSIFYKWRVVYPLVPYYRPGTMKFKHKLQLLAPIDTPVYTIFITGKELRNWGFHTPAGWVHHEIYEYEQSREVKVTKNYIER